MDDDQPMANPAEIAAELLHYACLARSRGTDRGCAELLGARVIEAQQAQIERLRAVGDEMAHLIRLDHQSCKPKHGKSIEDWCTYCATIARWKEARRG